LVGLALNGIMNHKYNICSNEKYFSSPNNKNGYSTILGESATDHFFIVNELEVYHVISQ
jgi:hypothetical protein